MTVIVIICSSSSPEDQSHSNNSQINNSPGRYLEPLEAELLLLLSTQDQVQDRGLQEKVLTHSLTHPTYHSFTHLLNQSFSHSFNESICLLLIQVSKFDSLTHSLNIFYRLGRCLSWTLQCQVNHSLTHSHTHSLTHLFTPHHLRFPLTLFDLSFSPSLTRPPSSTQLPTHSPIHSLGYVIQPLTHSLRNRSP